MKKGSKKRRSQRGKEDGEPFTQILSLDFQTQQAAKRVKRSGELANPKTKTGLKPLDWQKETYSVQEQMIMDTRLVSDQPTYQMTLCAYINTNSFSRLFSNSFQNVGAISPGTA
jgi:hypothetical protein